MLTAIAACVKRLDENVTSTCRRNFGGYLVKATVIMVGDSPSHDYGDIFLLMRGNSLVF